MFEPPSSYRFIRLSTSPRYIPPIIVLCLKLMYVHVATMEDIVAPMLHPIALMLPDTDLNSTTINTTENDIGKPGLLTTIPGEVRNKIWRMLLTTSYAFKEPASEGDPEAHYELQPALLRVNRQIYTETRDILRQENMWIVLCIAPSKEPVYCIDETARLPVISRNVFSGGPNDTFNCYLGEQAHALNVALCPEDNYPGGRNYGCHIMIMGPESLPYLLQLLFAMLYIDRSITPTRKIMMDLYVGRPTCFTRSRLQKEVLEPFSAARGFRNVFIKGNVDETFARSLEVRMESLWKSNTEVLDLSAAYLQKGDAAAAAGFPKAASFYYEQGSHFAFFAGQSHLDRFHPHASHVYACLPFATMLNAFDVRWAKVLLKLRCYADVQRLAASVLGRQAQSRATSDEKVQLVLCCAVASLGLGETARFSRIMRGLYRGTCNMGVFPRGSSWTRALKTREVFPDMWLMIWKKNFTVKDFDDLVAYCKEGEEGSLRLIDTGKGLPDRKEIEFPIAQDWSATSSRYERRRLTWARNKSVSDRN